jgi:purine-nucleoside phosphorylase
MNLHLVEPTGVDGQLDQDQVGIIALEPPHSGGSAMGGAIVHDPEDAVRLLILMVTSIMNPPRIQTGFCRIELHGAGGMGQNCATMRHVKATAARLKAGTSLRPKLAMILGSGFQNALRGFAPAQEIPYGQLPGFPTVGVTGHAGKLVFGHFDKIPALILKGRAHYYEGHEMDRVTFPVRVLAEFGVKTLLLTNAAGAINRLYRAGDLMVLQDHINFMGVSPLRGPLWPGLPPFVDLGQVYDPTLAKLAGKAAKASGLRWHNGVYLAVSGPNYETPAEIRAFRRLGADAVGMSTVPEAIVARQCGLAVAAVSCLTNLAGTTPSSGALAHQDVLAMGESRKDEIAVFLKTFARLSATQSE